MAGDGPTYGLQTASVESLRADFVATSCEMAVLGFHGALFIMSAYLLIQKGLRASQARRWLLVMTTIMFGFSVGSIVCSTEYCVVSMGSYAYYGDLPVDHDYMLRLNIATNVGLRANLFFSDVIVVWRAWVLYPDKLWPRVALSLALFGSFGGTVVSTVFMFLGRLDVDFKGPEYTSPILTVPLLFTNVVACVLVALKVWDYRKNVKAYLGNGSSASSIERTLLLILESGTVYCLLWLFLLLAGVDVLSERSNILLLSVAVSVAGLYPTTIIILVALEKSHTDTEGETSTGDDLGDFGAYQSKPDSTAYRSSRTDSPWQRASMTESAHQASGREVTLLSRLESHGVSEPVSEEKQRSESSNRGEL
ncbi:hypothetical protein BD626DRAFT_512077 [Schizophyllum amplum]|uniref:Uncharacterized protein n=1 Tax=Schizophyllum amplum TaxID=97359 RepID=A0A550C0F8_9AGAR|nr:hypothetical protein BD626DRAFT_512077 [Auriculariopsis ampla]